MRFSFSAPACALVAGLLLAGAAAAADALTEVARFENTTLDAADMAAAMSSVSAQERERFAASELSTRNLATDLVVRRELAARARAEGLADGAEVQRRLRLIEERALYEIYLEHAEATQIADATVAAVAREEYLARPERFTLAESVHARHILIGPGDDPAAAKARAESLLQRLRAGESFELLAGENSSDRGTAGRGGDLGFFDRGRMVKPFEDAAFALAKPGDLSDVVESQFGFHIIRLEEKRPAGLLPYEDVRAALESEARRRLRTDLNARIQAPMRSEGGIHFDAAALRESVHGNW